MTITKSKKVAAKSQAKSTTDAPPKEGYKGHREGSRKGKVHALFDKQGDTAAWTLGLKLKLKEGTLRAWFQTWRRETGDKGVAKKAA